jgi:hypothetical protein
MARSNRQKIKNIIAKMINELKKHCYGEDFPKTSSIKSPINSVKNTVSPDEKEVSPTKSVSTITEAALLKETKIKLVIHQIQDVKI